MAILNIPSSPSQGATYEANGVVYTWDGSKWKADSSYVSNLNSGQLAGFRNQIINGDFRIAQRGIAATETTNGYRTCDRWYVKRSASCEEEQVNNLAIEQEAGTSNTMRINPGNVGSINQMIEITKGRAGCFQENTTWTLSFYCNRDNTTVRLGFADGVSGSTNYVEIEAGAIAQRVGTTNRYAYTFTIGSSPNGNNSGVRLNLSPSSSEYTDFTGIQLEPGPVATPFEHRPIGTELALCQRYYQVYKPGSNTHSTVTAISATQALGPTVLLPVSMRVTPTGGCLGTIKAFSYINGAALTLTQYTQVTADSPQSFITAANCSPGNYDLNAQYLLIATAGLTFDAEL